MNNYLFISDAAKEVKVESHVLRYWEEELHLPIKRNELGHRYYTQEDVERFKQIKGMKERGLQLKAIRMILRDGKLDMLQEEEEQQDGPFAGMGIEIVEERPVVAAEQRDIVERTVSAEFKEDKARRLQWLLQEMIRQTIEETNRDLCREIRDSVVKELDYQFRMQEERDEAREKRLAERDEAYYQRMDELLRKKSRKGKARNIASGDVKQQRDKENISEQDTAVEMDLSREVENILAEECSAGAEVVKKRERSAEAVEQAIREKGLKRKKRHFF